MIELQTSVKQDDTTRTRTPKPGYLNLSNTDSIYQQEKKLKTIRIMQNKSRCLCAVPRLYLRVMAILFHAVHAFHYRMQIDNFLPTLGFLK
jgi:hypothetical protein